MDLGINLLLLVFDLALLKFLDFDLRLKIPILSFALNSEFGASQPRRISFLLDHQLLPSQFP